MVNPPTMDDEPDEGPEDYREAAEALMRYLALPPAVTDERIEYVADALYRLCDAGYLVSIGRHERLCEWYASKLYECEKAADELLDRIQGDGLVEKVDGG